MEETKEKGIPLGFTLKTNTAELSELLDQLEILLEKINNFKTIIYGYAPIEQSDFLEGQL